MFAFDLLEDGQTGRLEAKEEEERSDIFFSQSSHSSAVSDGNIVNVFVLFSLIRAAKHYHTIISPINRSISAVDPIDFEVSLNSFNLKEHRFSLRRSTL